MKNYLLTAICGAIALNVAAYNADVYLDASWQSISNNGQYVTSNVFGRVQIIDLKNNKIYQYIPDEYAGIKYSCGGGNNVSNDGVVLCTPNRDAAAYWENGEFHYVSVPKDAITNNILSGITPDGSRIVGIVGTAGVGYDRIMAVPAYWDRNDNGEYGEYHILPYPTTDFLGTTPQYVTATYVSNDGKTILGQVTESSGFYVYPILYTQDANGEWDYSFPLEEYFTIDLSTRPEYPGDAPKRPKQQDYMSPDKLDEYNDAYAAYVADRYNPALYPDPENYLTDEQLAEYNNAKANYDTNYKDWYAQYEAWYMWGLNNINSPYFVGNQFFLSPDGKTISANHVDYTQNPEVHTPWIVDLTTGNVTKHDSYGDNFSASQVIDANTFLGYNDLYGTPSTAYVVKNGVRTPLDEYLAATSPDMATWIDENLMHNTDYYDWDNDEYYENVKLAFTGLARASADMKTFAFWTMINWNDNGNVNTGDRATYCYGYVVNLSDEESGISSVTVAENEEISFDANGNLNLGDNIQSAQVYDLSGRLVLNNGQFANQLSSGVYIVRAQRNDGTSVSAKICK